MESCVEQLRLRLSGVLCATLTPFTPGGEVDWPAIRSNARWLLAQGVRCFLVNGTIGEYPALTAEERRRALEETIAACIHDREAVVLAGCSDQRPARVVEFCHHARQAGAQGVLLLAPHQFLLSQAELLDFFRFIDAAIDLPLIVYNNPAAARADLPLDVLEELSRLKRFAAVKDASGSVSRIYEEVERFGQRFPVIAANEDTLLFSLVAGAQACMTASAAFAPQLLMELVRSVDTGDRQAASAAFRRLYAFRRLLQAELRAGRPAYIPYTKAAMELVGLRAGAPRPPLFALATDMHERLRHVLTTEVGIHTVL